MRSLAQIEAERAEQPFLPLKGRIPQLLYEAVVLLFELVRRMLSGRRPDANDVAQDLASAFLYEQDKNGMLDVRGKTPAELRRYCEVRARRDVIDHIRDPRQRDHRPLPDEDYDAPSGIAADATIERVLEIEGYAQDIERAIRSLTDKEEEVIRLRWREQMDFDEIARTLGMKESTARGHAARAYKKMQPALEHLRTAHGRS